MKRILLVTVLAFLLMPAARPQLMERLSTFVNIKGSETISTEATIPMMIVEPSDGYFNPARMQSRYPRLEIPLSRKTIIHPEMSGYADTAYMMMFIRDKAYLNRGFINIVVIGIVSDQELHYFIDDNSNYLFTEDETKIIFTPDIEKARLEMDTRSGTSEFYLYNPVYSDAEPYESSAGLAWAQDEDVPAYYFDFSVTFGSGKATLAYTPDNKTTGRVSYSANIFAFGLFRAGMVMGYKNINLGLYGGFEQVQYTERNKYSYSADGEEHVAYMSGLWMWSKLSVDMTVEYDLRLDDRLKLSPLVSAGYWTAVDGRSFDPNMDHPEDARYTGTWRYEYGLKMKLLISDYSFIYFKLGNIRSMFDARQYITDYSTGYNLKYSRGYLGIGYTYDLKGIGR